MATITSSSSRASFRRRGMVEEAEGEFNLSDPERRFIFHASNMITSHDFTTARSIEND
jgi:hypothetical protein